MIQETWSTLKARRRRRTHAIVSPSSIPIS